MLSRAADSLYWMSRYMERAENMARLLDVSYRMSLTATDAFSQHTQWEPALVVAGCEAPFRKTGKKADARNVIEFLALDADNPSSIRAALWSARENARAMRTQITTEMWEALNSTWLEMRALDYARIEAMGLRVFFDWVKERSHLFRGVGYGTMTRDAAYRFVRVGTFLERADATARLLDVKYHVLLPSTRDVGGAVDYYQWGALLRSVSAFQAYRRLYRDAIVPRRVAELLVLREDMPRSLRSCFRELTRLLDELREMFARDYVSARLADQMYNRLRFETIDNVNKQGLHEFLTEVVENNAEIGKAIAKDFGLDF